MRSRLATVVLVLLVATLASAQTDSAVARLSSYDGRVDVIRLGIPIALYPELPLFAKDIVFTKEGRARIRFTDRSEIRLKPNTRVALGDRPGSRDIDVFFGRLWSYVVSHPGRPTNFKTGGTLAAVRGTDLEYSAGQDGFVQVGVNSGGPVDVQSTLPDGSSSAVSLNAGEGTTVPRGGVPSPPSPHQPGEITGEHEAPPDTTAEPAPPAPEPAPEPGIGLPPGTEPIMPPPAGSEQPATPTAAVAAPVLTETECADLDKQGAYALQVINALGITTALPPNATVRDAMDFLTNLGLVPASGGCNCQSGPRCECTGHWDADACVRIEDLLCFIGTDPCDPEAPLAISLDELINQLVAHYGELFWLQTRKKLTTSPFAP